MATTSWAGTDIRVKMIVLRIASRTLSSPAIQL